MKQDLLETLDEIIILMTECNFQDKADWLREKKSIIEGEKEGTPSFKKASSELNKIASGMGSFSDLVLIPRKGADLTEKQAEKKQRMLIHLLWEATKGKSDC